SSDIEVRGELPLNTQIPLLRIRQPISIEWPIHGVVIVKGLTVIVCRVDDGWLLVICGQALAQDNGRGNPAQRISKRLRQIETGDSNAPLPVWGNSSIVEDPIAGSNDCFGVEGISNSYTWRERFLEQFFRISFPKAGIAPASSGEGQAPGS